ncbi:MAG: DinB family protein [Bacteroidota bacterium]
MVKRHPSKSRGVFLCFYVAYGPSNERNFKNGLDLLKTIRIIQYMTNTAEIFVTNFEDIRERSINLWHHIPHEYLHWKSKGQSFSCIELVRHVLEQEYLLFKSIKTQGRVNRSLSPWNGKKYGTVADELNFAAVYRSEFIQMVSRLENVDFQSVYVGKPKDNLSKKSLALHLNQMAYHESIHTGELIQNLTTLGLKWSLFK